MITPEQRIENAIEELKLAKEALHKTKEMWKPKQYDNYFTISSYGCIEPVYIFLEGRQLIGNAFETRQQAEQHVELLKATQRLKEAIFILNDNEFPEWDWDEGRETFYIGLLSNELRLLSVFYKKTLPSWYYLRSIDAVEKLIESHRDDLMTYLSQ